MRPSSATVERAQQQQGAVFCEDRKQKAEISRGLRLLPQSKGPGKTKTGLPSEAFARLAAGSRTPVEEPLARLAPDVHSCMGPNSLGCEFRARACLACHGFTHGYNVYTC